MKPLRRRHGILQRGQTLVLISLVFLVGFTLVNLPFQVAGYILLGMKVVLPTWVLISTAVLELLLGSWGGYWLVKRAGLHR